MTEAAASPAASPAAAPVARVDLRCATCQHCECCHECSSPTAPTVPEHLRKERSVTSVAAIGKQTHNVVLVPCGTSHVGQPCSFAPQFGPACTCKSFVPKGVPPLAPKPTHPPDPVAAAFTRLTPAERAEVGAFMAGLKTGEKGAPQ